MIDTIHDLLCDRNLASREPRGNFSSGFGCQIEVRSTRKGYALLLVLVALVLATTALTQLADRVMRTHFDSLEAEKQLQMKWGGFSCERVAMQRAVAYFDQWERRQIGNRQRNQEPAAVRQHIVLGGCQFQLLIADENAKANLNVLTSRVRRGTLQTERALIGVKFAQDLQLSRIAPLDTLGQIWDFQRLLARHGTLRVLPEATRNVTIWGSGKLNIHRATDTVFREVAATAIPKGRADRLLESFRDSPQSDVELLLRRTIKNEAERRSLESLLADGSSTYSVWTEATTNDRTDQLSLRVRTIDPSGLETTLRFSFD